MPSPLTENIRIDSHQHFWHYNTAKQSWMDDEMSVIRKDFLPQDLAPILLENNIAGCIAVEADQTEAETDFLLQLAKENSFIKGIVGWVNLTAENIHERLAHYAQYNIIKGFRHVLQSEEPEFMLQSNFLKGIAALEKHGFTYDILIFPKHLKAATELVQKFPNQPFVIDHIAKPYIKAGLIDEWQEDMAKIARHNNVYCKVSGMVTEADCNIWKPEDFTPYIDAVVNTFGTKRIMYGSDWPVCQVAGSYKQVLQIVQQYFSSFSVDEQQNIFCNTATRFYRL